MDLKLRFRIGIGLVNNIALPAPAAGTGAKSSLWTDNNSRCFAVNNLWYRCNWDGSMTEPRWERLLLNPGFHIGGYYPPSGRPDVTKITSTEG
jgi:hypothetical protein